MKRRGFSYMGDSPPSSSAVDAAGLSKSHLDVPRTTSSIIANGNGGSVPLPPNNGGGPPFPPKDHDDRLNYALLLALYTLQGIPIGLSASIPFLIQQKVQMIASSAAHHVGADGEAVAGGMDHSHSLAELTKTAYNAQAVFALCSWPFSLKLLWAPIVDACFSKRFGRRKSWLVPIQLVAGALMVGGSDYVERELGLDNAAAIGDGAAADAAGSMNVRGVTSFFFALYFLMATQDIAVDGWALTMLSRKNRGKGPICNSIGQNIGYFLSYVGFLALNDAESSENLWRPLLRLPSKPGVGLVSLGGFVRFMGTFMLVITVLVGLFKKEIDMSIEGGDCCTITCNGGRGSAGGTGDEDAETLLPKRTQRQDDDDDEEDHEIDAYEIGIAETYHRLWAVVRLPAVRSLILILLTYRLPCALSDNVKFLKAVEFGLSKQTTALLSPTIVLPLGIVVPIVATRIWRGHPLRQFMWAYKFRVTFVALVDVLMLLAVRSFLGGSGRILGGEGTSRAIFWTLLIASTALQATVHSLQFNSQMTFFAHRVDPAIGGTYMTLLNTFANLGGTWPSSFIMYLIGQLTVPPDCKVGDDGAEVCTGGRDAYFPLQTALSVLGCLWIFFMGKRVQHVAELPDDAWRTHIGEGEDAEEEMEGLKKGGKHA